MQITLSVNTVDRVIAGALVDIDLDDIVVGHVQDHALVSRQPRCAVIGYSQDDVDRSVSQYAVRGHCEPCIRLVGVLDGQWLTGTGG